MNIEKLKALGKIIGRSRANVKADLGIAIFEKFENSNTKDSVTMIIKNGKMVSATLNESEHSCHPHLTRSIDITKNATLIIDRDHTIDNFDIVYICIDEKLPIFD